MNVCFEYLYRDAGNYKLWGEVVFTNKQGLTIDKIEEKIRRLLIDNEYFEAEKIGIPVLRFEIHDPELDHQLHEFVRVTAPSVQAGESGRHDIGDLILALEKTAPHSPNCCPARNFAR
jgi:hypothetical protein